MPFASATAFASLSESLRADILRLAPCYLYEEKTILSNARALLEAFAPAGVLYSVKANPFAPVLKTLAAAGLGADAASAGEVELALAAGFAPERIYYSAPGKTARDIKRALDKCTIVADSLHEIDLLGSLAQRCGRTLAIGIRLAADFDMAGSGAKPGKFGIPIEQCGLLKELLRRHPRLIPVGLHLHVQSQVLEAAKLALFYERAAALFETAARTLGIEHAFINFGSGIGVAYDEAKDTPLDVAKLGVAFHDALARHGLLCRARALIESGRYIVCQAGLFITPVVDIKQCRGKTFVIVQGGANGFIRPVMETLITDNNPSAAGQEPFFTRPGSCGFCVLDSAGRPRTGSPVCVELVGSLCTALDTLGHDAALAGDIQIGDFIAAGNAGSYGKTLSACGFASFEPPREILLSREGTLALS